MTYAVLLVFLVVLAVLVSLGPLRRQGRSSAPDDQRPVPGPARSDERHELGYLLDDARYAVAYVRASLTGSPLPERPHRR